MQRLVTGLSLSRITGVVSDVKQVPATALAPVIPGSANVYGRGISRKRRIFDKSYGYAVFPAIGKD